jgi:hypothetical protein
MFFGVRVIAERIVIRLGSGEKVWLVEMSIDESKLFAVYLDRAISRVEQGFSVSDDFDAFITTLPGHEV